MSIAKVVTSSKEDQSHTIALNLSLFGKNNIKMMWVDDASLHCLDPYHITCMMIPTQQQLRELLTN